MELSLPEDFLKYYNQDVFAKAAISIFHDEVMKSESTKITKQLFQTKKHLLAKYNTNVVVKNALTYYLYLLGQQKHTPREKYHKILQKITEANQEIAKNGAKKIKAGSTIFVHSLTNQVFDVLKKAATYKQFTVNLLEHAPFKLGTNFKKHSNQKIHINLFPDIALRQAVESADLCLIGADVITKKGVISKTGSSLAIDVATQNNVPVCVCAHSWMYDSKEEMSNLITNKHEQADQDYKNTHEYFSSDKINSIICEYGILKPQHITTEIKFYNRWMFM